MNKKILKAQWGSQYTPLVMGDLKIPCYVLEDGTRVLSGRGMQKALGFGDQKASYKSSGSMLSKLLKMPYLAPFFGPALQEQLNKRIEFIRPTSGGSAPITHGYEATLLIDICYALIDAKKAGTLTAYQRIYADHAEIIVKAVSKVGIIALIDETTGYQGVRQSDALQKILDTYLSKELAAWAKRFPDEFYKQIFRLKGWNWPISKKPLEVGRITKDIVYKRLAPGIVEELEQRNPCTDKGYRKVKHHQYLTNNIGHPALSQHIHALTILMRSAPTWNQFYDRVQVALPVKNESFLAEYEGIRGNLN